MNKASIFLLEKKKDKYEFNFPKDVYIDTCFWNEAYGTSSNKMSKYECVEFLTSCAREGSTLYVSGIVYDEIQHIFKRSIIDKAVEDKEIRLPKYNDGAVNQKELFQNVCDLCPDIRQTIEKEINTILSIIDETAQLLDFENDIEFNLEVRNLYKEFNYEINISDLKHAIISHMYGINHIATRDGDFWMFDNMNIYTPSESYMNTHRLGRRNVELPFDKNQY